MENALKALIVAGVILLSILIISIGIYTYNNATSTTSGIVLDTAMEMQLMQFNKQYEMYEGIQGTASIKQLLNTAAQNNQELYKDDNEAELCVCIRSKSKNILSKASSSSNGQMKVGLTTRSFGVKYPSSIKEISPYLGDNERYNIELAYNEYGYVWEIWINDIN